MERHASIQELFKAANDHTFDLLWGTEAGAGAFLCECKRPVCGEVVSMTVSDFTRLRDRHGFVCAPGHDDAAERDGTSVSGP